MMLIGVKKLLNKVYRVSCILWLCTLTAAVYCLQIYQRRTELYHGCMLSILYLVIVKKHFSNKKQNKPYTKKFLTTLNQMFSSITTK